MKTRYFMIGAALCSTMGLGLTSCDNEKFLDVNQYEVVASDASFENDANAKKGLNGVYDMMFPNDNFDGDWGFKPNLFTGCHPTIDTQATGWDKNWNVQAWNSGSTELLGGWKHVYHGIVRANDYLAGLAAAPEDNISPDVSILRVRVVPCVVSTITGWLPHSVVYLC